MGIMQTMLGGGTSLALDIAEYVSNNWASFHKGIHLTSQTNSMVGNRFVTDGLDDYGGVLYGPDTTLEETYQPILANYSLAQFPYNVPATTIFYFDIKSESFYNHGLNTASTDFPRTPQFMAGTNSISGAAVPLPIVVANEQQPPAAYSWYESSPNVFVRLGGTWATQANTVVAAPVLLNCKDLKSSIFYMSAINMRLSSPSTLAVPGYWSTVYDTGATGFTIRVVGQESVDGEVFDVNGFVMNTSAVSFSVLPGDLVVAIGGIARHFTEIVPANDMYLVTSWTRKRVLTVFPPLNSTDAGQSMTVWFSRATATYTVPRTMSTSIAGQFPNSRIMVFRMLEQYSARPLG